MTDDTNAWVVWGDGAWVTFGVSHVPGRRQQALWARREGSVQVLAYLKSDVEVAAVKAMMVLLARGTAA